MLDLCYRADCVGPAGATIALCGVIDLLMGGRSSILGLAGFVTLPSREIVTVWQFTGIMAGSGELMRVMLHCPKGAMFCTSVCAAGSILHYNP